MLAEFEIAIDRLERAIRGCPEEHWGSSLWVVKRTDPWMWPKGGPGDGRTEAAIQVFSQFWLIAYHCLFFIDLYCWDETGHFATPPEFANGPEDQGIDEFGAARFPNVSYSREQLLGYLAYGRGRVRTTLGGLTDAQRAIKLRPGHPHAGKTFEQLLGVNLAHVREHGDQLTAFIAGGCVTRP
ncbi:MAG TPA: DinB family protein [Candidatus Dormibacteraeota bacterium]